MDEPILPDAFSGESDEFQTDLYAEDWHSFEDGQFGSRGEPAYSGPAGEVSLELAEGIWITVDFAEGDPGRVVSLVIDAGCRSPFLVSLFGEDRAIQIEETLGNTISVNLGARRGASIPLPPTVEAASFIEIAKMKSIAEDPAVHDVARACAALEAVEEMRRASVKAPRFDELTQDLLELAVNSLEGEEQMLVLLHDRLLKTAARFAGLCQRNSRSTPELDRYRRLLEFGREDDVDARESFALDSERLSEEWVVPASAGETTGSPEEFDDGSSRKRESLSRIELSEGGLLEATSPIYQPDRWVRVLNSASLELLAIAELRKQEDGSSIATALVAPGTSLNQTFCEILEGPRPIQRSSLERVAAAVRLGRRATRAESISEARSRWTVCAEAWAELGDELRARIAQRYAEAWRRDPFALTVAEEVANFAERFEDPL
jgi:hypothetical protein